MSETDEYKAIVERLEKLPQDGDPIEFGWGYVPPDFEEKLEAYQTMPILTEETVEVRVNIPIGLRDKLIENGAKDFAVDAGKILSHFYILGHKELWGPK